MATMRDPWPTIDASTWTLAGIEQQGLHKHDWYRDDSETRTWLFKPARAERHRSLGEDVAEKLASHLAHLVDIPAARVELAVRDGVQGTLVEDVRPSGWSLQHGQVLMSEAVEQYDPDNRERRGHSPSAIRVALERFDAPPGAKVPADFAAFDVFVGYLIFDALIAHVDRHDRNWALLVQPPGEAAPDTLCPSFDHAASLGFTLSEAECAEHVRVGSVARWASQGKATRFEHQRGAQWQTLVELAGSAAEMCSDATRQHWRERILSVDRDSVTALASAAPTLSDVTHDFIIELVMVNRGRLLDELS